MRSTRRAVLRRGIGLAIGGLAGCVSKKATANGAADRSTGKPGTPFESISFEDEYLVVTLVEDYDVERVNLIAPDGSLFAQAQVQTGVTRVRLQILKIEPVNWKHYTPGLHELVAVSENGEFVKEIELIPNLQMLDIRQYEGGEIGDSGLIIVEIENIGSGPSWVYEIAFDNPPNWTTDNDLGEDPGFLFFSDIMNSSDPIIHPGETAEFVSMLPPLLFNDPTKSCSSNNTRFVVKVGRPIGKPLLADVRVEFGGELETIGILDQYLCSEISIDHFTVAS